MNICVYYNCKQKDVKINMYYSVGRKIENYYVGLCITGVGLLGNSFWYKYTNYLSSALPLMKYSKQIMMARNLSQQCS